MAHECANKLKKKTNLKASLTTWDDDSDSDDSNDEQKDQPMCIAFTASLNSHTIDTDSLMIVRKMMKVRL